MIALLVPVLLITGVAFAKTPTEAGIDFAKTFQKVVEQNRKALIVKDISYPTKIYFVSSKLTLHSQQDAGDLYDTWMTPYLYNLITKTPPAKLVKLLEIKRDERGAYKVHHLLFTGDPADFRYSKDGIYSAKALLHIIAVLRKGAEAHCARCVAKVIEFPLTECIGGRWIKIRNAAQFIKHYDQIVTPEVKELMLHAWERHNWFGFPEKGIMLGGDGDIWIGSFGHKNAQGFYVWETKVTTLLEVAPPGCPIQ